MKTFKDNEAREWIVSVTMGSVRRVKDLAGVNLAHISEDDTLQKIASDPDTLCRVIWAMILPQATERNLTEDAFFDSMGGDAIDGATAALLADLPDFFPKSRRQVLHKAVGKLKEVEQKAAEIAIQQMESPEMAAKIESILSGADMN